jgi:hypothetical protein
MYLAKGTLLSIIKELALMWIHTDKFSERVLPIYHTYYNTRST